MYILILFVIIVGIKIIYSLFSNVKSAKQEKHTEHPINYDKIEFKIDKQKSSFIQKPSAFEKNKWLNTTDGLGKMETGRVGYNGQIIINKKYLKIQDEEQKRKAQERINKLKELINI